MDHRDDPRGQSRGSRAPAGRPAGQGASASAGSAKARARARQAKAMAAFYGVSLDSLLSFDVRLEEIKNAISQSDGNFQKSLDWTALWAEKYPVLASYKGTVDIERYQKALSELLSSLKSEYGYNDLDALLVLKDILGSAAKP